MDINQTIQKLVYQIIENVQLGLIRFIKSYFHLFRFPKDCKDTLHRQSSNLRATKNIKTNSTLKATYDMRKISHRKTTSSKPTQT